MTDVFISYSKARRSEAEELARELGELGYEVWWDTSLVPTGSFGAEIDRQLDAAKAVIVIWSPESVRSNWVRSEAMHANRQEKLVNAHTVEISDPSLHIPKPFDITHSVLVEELRPLVGALDMLNVPRSGGAQMAAAVDAPLTANVADADDGLFAEVEQRGMAADYEYYLNELPEGRHALVARMRLRDLQQELAAQQAAAEEAKRRQQLTEAELRQKEGPWEFLVGIGSGAEKRLLKPGDNFKDFKAGPEMVVIKPGTFLMGSPDDELGRNDDEMQHEVIISNPFAMGRYAVTVSEYMDCVKAGKCRRPEWQENGSKYNITTGSSDFYKKLGSALTSDRFPIVGVSWEDAQAYIEWLNDKTGRTYRLLSEAEWEYACRAGTTTAYSFGDHITKQQAQLEENQTTEVGSFPPNQFGLYDMHGNVWECVHDWHEDYNKTAVTDPKGPSSGSYRVIRGGGWLHDARDLRSALRNDYSPGNRSNDTGFRLLRQP